MIKTLTHEEIQSLLKTHWGSDFIVIRETVFEAKALKGLALYNKEDQLIGFATYMGHDDHFEIMSLNAFESGFGHGSKLIKALLNTANDENLPRIRVTTTNDNTKALRFYQKFGFTIVDINFGAVDRARLLKPDIPLYDEQIRIEHEVTLELVLGRFR